MRLEDGLAFVVTFAIAPAIGYPLMAIWGRQARMRSIVASVRDAFTSLALWK